MTPLCVPAKTTKAATRSTDSSFTNFMSTDFGDQPSPFDERNPRPQRSAHCCTQLLHPAVLSPGSTSPGDSQ